MLKVLRVVSMSSGKDSTATALLAIEQYNMDECRFVFADTGNEHPIVYEYLEYLEYKLGIKIDRLKRDFILQIAGKKEYVLSKWADKGVPQGVIERAAKALVPTGNPYLDLCIWKGRFPSRKAQFCTQFLKTMPLLEYNIDLLDNEAFMVFSWQGVRASESESRARLLPLERVDDGRLYNYRPILDWTAEDCFKIHARHGIKPNPLYSMGMNRVGCMPCINAAKGEIREISKRFPEQIERIAEWESMVALASKRQESSFFPSPDDSRGDLMGRGIRDVVRWSRTTHGGKQQDMMALIDSSECQSAYGLCG
ncbi:MAG: phosphoadenosine phosphosulfate reductase [Anaerolineaceae bacterium]|nr:MAG: phosphoadenosine phosphosulfate reductase [Anaerolineaceae bacterium]